MPAALDELNAAMHPLLAIVRGRSEPNDNKKQTAQTGLKLVQRWASMGILNGLVTCLTSQDETVLLKVADAIGSVRALEVSANSTWSSLLVPAGVPQKLIEKVRLATGVTFRHVCVMQACKSAYTCI